jgi:hypothetical protein
MPAICGFLGSLHKTREGGDGAAMLRWIVRLYVSFVLFVVFVFCDVAALKEMAHLLAKAGLPAVSGWFSAHDFLAALFAGLFAGLVPVDSRLTGEGWFRSKHGRGFEGFRLDQLRPWTWLMVTPLVIFGVTALFLEETQSALSITTLSSFIGNLIARNCSDVWTQKNWFDTSCNVQLVLVAPWIASVGYSIAPIIRKRGSQVLLAIRNSGEITEVQQKSEKKLKKADL